MSENRLKTGRKAPRTAFLPGKSGNPGGRPRKTDEEFALVKACQDKSPTALAVIEKLMHEADKDSVRLSAATFVIERGFGKTVERIERPSALEEWAIEDLVTVRDELRRRVAAKGLLNGPQPLPALSSR